jgi:glycosyltransferase involved in cell wall biosynthesis
VLYFIQLQTKTKIAPTTAPTIAPTTANAPKDFLCLLGSLKNDSMIVKEWIEHYIWQGVDRLYIIDNGSTDDTKSKLEEYGDKIKYFFLPEEHAQTKNYNIAFQRAPRTACSWLIVCDSDEYMYSRESGTTIASFLRFSLDYTSISNVQLMWKMFGSSGHILQPDGIRKSFLRRASHGDFIRGWDVGRGGVPKQIHNASLIDSLDVHYASYIPSSARLLSEPRELALNHYPIMSIEFFVSVKMGRSAVFSKKNDTMRDFHYFADYDTNDIYDDELCRLIGECAS